MIIKRSELVEGKKYFMNDERDVIGVFKGRDEDLKSIYFDCGEQNKYHTSLYREGLVMFWSDDHYEGFIEAE